MKKYLESTIKELEGEKANAKDNRDNAISESNYQYATVQYEKRSFAIIKLNLALNYLNAQNESQNVSGNEGEKEVCARCGLTADGTLYDEPMCEGCLHVNT